MKTTIEKRNTQAAKLAAVLSVGRLSMLSLEECQKHIPAYAKECQGYADKGWSWYQFEPYELNGDLETVSQWSPNPFILVDTICEIFELI